MNSMPSFFSPSLSASNDHIVVAGNPGVGKSAILNCIIGSVQFESDVRLGKGLTSVLDTYTANGVKFSDTPGLDDVEIRKKAAREISNAFTEGGRFKLLFVVTLESGRIKPADKATIEVILDAIKAVGVNTDFRYSIIVNKCDKGVLKALQVQEDRARLEIALGSGTVMDHIGYMPLVPTAVGERNVILGGRSKYIEFIKSAPSMELPENNAIEVQAENYDTNVELLREELRLLREQLEEAFERKSKNRGPVKSFLVGMSDGIISSLEYFFEKAVDVFILS